RPRRERRQSRDRRHGQDDADVESGARGARGGHRRGGGVPSLPTRSQGVRRRGAVAGRIARRRARVCGRFEVAAGAARGGRRTASGPARVVTATGNPAAVEESAVAAGFSPVRGSPYRDHHWFTVTQARRELERARDDAATLLLTAKDAVRWPVPDERVAVLEV